MIRVADSSTLPERFRRLPLCGFKIDRQGVSLGMGSARGAAVVARSLREPLEDCFRQAGRFRATQVPHGLDERAVPAVVPLGAGDFMLHSGEGAEKQLGDVGEHGGVARRDPITGH